MVAARAEREAIREDVQGEALGAALGGTWRDLARKAADCRAAGLPLSDALLTQAELQAEMAGSHPFDAVEVALNRMAHLGLRAGPVAGLTEQESRARSMWADMDTVGQIAEALAVTHVEVKSIIANLYARGLLLAP